MGSSLSKLKVIHLLSPSLWNDYQEIFPNTLLLDEQSIIKGVDFSKLEKRSSHYAIISILKESEFGIYAERFKHFPYKGFLSLSEDPEKVPTPDIYDSCPYIVLQQSIRPFYIRQAVSCIKQQLARQVETKQISEQLEYINQNFQHLVEISKALTTEKDFDKLIGLILEQVRRSVCADSGSIYVLEEKEIEVPASASNGASSHPQHQITKKPQRYLRFKRSALMLDTNEFVLPIDRNSIAGYVALTGESLNIEDVYNLPDDLPFSFNPEIDRTHNYHTKSMLVIPMVNQNEQIMGVLQLINRKDDFKKKLRLEDMRGGGAIPFSEGDRIVASMIADQSAIAMYNQQLINEQSQLFESFIHIIDSSIDSKSDYTGGHCHRVPVLTEMLAKVACESKGGSLEDFNLSRDEWYELRIAAGLHDCGKIVTPVHVMDKATKLETINDRIEIIKIRFELLRRDAHLEHQERSSKESMLSQRLEKIDDMQNFIERVNIGSEFLTQEDKNRIDEISKETYFLRGEKQSLLTEEECENLRTIRGTLTREERLIINGHMVETVKMLDALPFPESLKRVPEYACGHHEKMDGTGYPRGLFAGDMSIPARIIAIADVFEALTATDRPYKKGKTLSEAMKIMGDMKANNHLDPELFNLFVSSKIYIEYAKNYMSPELIDDIDETTLLAIQARPFVLPPESERKKRWNNFLPEYETLVENS